MSSARSARRPRWCRPWIELSVRPVWVAISVGDSPAKWRRTSTSRWSTGKDRKCFAELAHGPVARGVPFPLVAGADLLDRGGALAAQVVDGEVPGDPA